MSLVCSRTLARRLSHLRLAYDFRALKRSNRLSRAAGTRMDGFGIFDVAFVGQLFVIDAGNFDVNVDTVQERATDLLLVAGNGHGGTTAFFDGVAIKAAGAGIHCRKQHEIRRVGDSTLST